MIWLVLSKDRTAALQVTVTFGDDLDHTSAVLRDASYAAQKRYPHQQSTLSSSPHPPSSAFVPLLQKEHLYDCTSVFFLAT
jgi:hypothetical protein